MMSHDRGGTLLRRAWRRILGLLSDETGLTVAEYALLLALVILVSVACFSDLGRATGDAASDGQMVITGDAQPVAYDESGGAAPPTGP